MRCAFFHTFSTHISINFVKLNRFYFVKKYKLIRAMRRSYVKVLFKQSHHRGQLPHPWGRQKAKPLNLILEIPRAQRWRAELFDSNNQNISPYSTLVSIGLCYELVSCDNYTKSNCWVSTKFHGAKRLRKIRKFSVFWYMYPNKKMWVVNDAFCQSNGASAEKTTYI